VTRLADFKANAYHEGELQTLSTNLPLTGTKYIIAEPTARGAAPNQFPYGMSAIAIGDQPASLAGDTIDNTSAIGRRWNTFDFRDAPSGSAWLTGVSLEAAASAGGNGEFVGTGTVLDILWWNGQNLSTASTSTITSPTWPARDRSAATSGDGVGIGMLTFATQTGVTDVTLGYTNSGGTGSRTATMVGGVPTAAGQASFFDLQAGDTGVQQVNSITRGTIMTSANYVLFAYRIVGIARIVNYHASGNGPTNRSGLLDFPAKIHPGSVLFLGAHMTSGLTTTIASWRARYSYSSL
jgi:hypothetical protein